MAQNTTDAQKKVCACGCRTYTQSAVETYNPGHDARHVSNLLNDLFEVGTPTAADVRGALRSLPSLPLQHKLTNAVENRIAKAALKAERAANGRQSRTEWVDCDTDVYKIGRWEYPVQVKMYREGISGLKPGQESEYLDFRRNTKRDGSGEWVALEGGELISL